MGKCNRIIGAEGYYVNDIVLDMKVSATEADRGSNGDLVVTADSTGLIEKAVPSKANVTIAGVVLNDRGKLNGFSEVFKGYAGILNSDGNGDGTTIVQSDIGSDAFVAENTNGSISASSTGASSNPVLIGKIVNVLSTGRVIVKIA